MATTYYAKPVYLTAVLAMWCCLRCFLLVVEGSSPVVLQTSKVHNHQQCHRQCWYRQGCESVYYYGGLDADYGVSSSLRNNCVLLSTGSDGMALAEGWTQEEASERGLQDYGCRSRPCNETEMCLPVHGNGGFVCAEAPTQESWLETPSNGTDSLNVTDTVTAQCLCPDGHFFSYSENACVVNCSNLHGMYLFYKGWNHLHGLDMDIEWRRVWEPETCKTECDSNPECFSFVFINNVEQVENVGYCYFKNVTAVGSWVEKDTCDSYQKACA